MKRPSNRTTSKSKLQYNELETRHLLAAIINGTSGDDVLNVTFIDNETVGYTLNGDSHKLDVSEGLNIKLHEGNDQVTLNSRIVADVQLIYVEDISFVGKSSDWQIGFVEDPRQPSQYIAAGSVNENVSFLGATTVNGLAGHDTFNVNMENSSSLRIYGEGADDVFRFSSGRIDPTGVKAMGGSGNDQFIFFGAANALVEGERGFDVVEFRSSNHQVNLRSGQMMQSNERIIAPADTNSSVRAPSAPVGEFSYAWKIDGSLTTLTNESSGWSIELVNFQKFEGSSHGFDRFWVLGTENAIEVWDADWMQISSDIDASKGSLDRINHDVSIVRSAGYYVFDGDTVELIEDEDGVISPRVVISDIMSGDTNVAYFDAQSAITGLAVGDIKFIDMAHDISSGPEDGIANAVPQTGVPEDSDFQPEIIVHGSELTTDQFIVESVWTPTTIYAHGGDDEFLVGSSIEAGNGNLSTIRRSLDVFGGDGDDRMVANNHHGHHEAFRMSSMSLRSPTEAGDSKSLVQIGYNESLELVRINGSAKEATIFSVYPSQFTTFVVDGMAQQTNNDQLRLIGSVDGRLFNTDGTGSWQLEDGFKPVHFYGIEETPQIAPKILDGFFETLS